MTPDEIRELRCEITSLRAEIEAVLSERLERAYGTGYREGGNNTDADYFHAVREYTDWPEDDDVTPMAVAVRLNSLTERLAQAWDEGNEACCFPAYKHLNPYRSHADSGRSRGSVSDEQGAREGLGQDEGSGAQIACPTCGPNETEQHPHHPRVTRCANCKEWLRIEERA